MSRTIEIRKPDDWHVHLRDGEELKALVPWTARHFARAIVMPNLKTPITSSSLARDYRARIQEATPSGMEFEPLMTFYLTDETDTADLEKALKSRLITAAKLYPAHATTNSALGVTDIRRLDPALEVLSALGRPLLVHAESSDPNVDVFDRERVFLHGTLRPLMERHPHLKVVVEHITTKEAIQFVREQGSRCAATITAHHLLINRNAMFQGGMRPHAYCLPVAKREEHRLALIEAAVSGEACFFLGTDSAPHSLRAKESACGCAGIFSAPTALALYAQVFASRNRLEQFENFASVYGPRFYEQPLNEERVLLKEAPVSEPAFIRLSAENEVAVFEGGKPLSWSIA